MMRFATIVIILLLGYISVFAQQPEQGVTTVIREWDSSENIKHLNEKYDINSVSMDEVIYIKVESEPKPELGTSSVGSSSTSMGGAMSSGGVATQANNPAPAPIQVSNPAPETVQANTPAPTPVQVSNPAPQTVQANTPAPKPVSTSSSTSTSSTKSYPKTSTKKKRTKMKRVKLKKKKFKKYRGKSCFKF